MFSIRALNVAFRRKITLQPTSLSFASRHTRTFSLFGLSSDPKPEKTSQPPNSTTSTTNVAATQPEKGQPRSREDHDKDLKDTHDEIKAHHKTLKEMDDELMAKMAGISGDGGDAGVEFEDGQPVAMKRR